MLDLFDGWKGLMDKESIAASVYSYTMYYFSKSLFHAYVEGEVENRLLYSDNYLMHNVNIRLLESAAKDGNTSHFNPICRNGYPDYSGKNHCSYNLAKSFIDAKNFLEANMSAKHTDWKWGNLIVRDYKNLPWSMTALKPIFHRETSTAGNANTLDVSRYTHMKNVNNTIFHQSHGATYKQIV